MNETVAGTVRDLRQGIARGIGDDRFQTWFGDKVQIELEDGKVRLQVASRFVGEWIGTNYVPAIEAAYEKICGAKPVVEILLNGAARSTQRAGAAVPARRDPPKRIQPDRVTDLASLTTFVVGRSNELAYTTARRAVEELSEPYRPLLIHGGVGLGKTHLVQGICRAVQREHPLLTCIYIRGEDFTNQFIAALDAHNEQNFRDRYRNCDVLIVDDIHFLENKRATQGEFLYTFKAIQESGKSRRAIILSCDRHPRLLSLAPPLQDRLGSGTVVEIHPPDLETRKEILRRRASAYRREVPEAVVDFIARNVAGNVRGLDGAFYRLIAVAALNPGPITLPLAQQALYDLVTDPKRALTVESIEDAVLARFGINRNMLYSAARDRIVSGARSIVMYLVRKHLRLSFPQIGRLMGNKNHTTVLVAARRVEEQLTRDTPITVKSANGFVDASSRILVAELEAELGCSAS